MIESFLKLSNEKKETIMQAAICIFAKNGYKKTAVDEIVAKAKISKGILFHYFKNKKSFYLFLFEYYTKLSTEQIQSKLDYNEQDLFEKLKQVEHIKIELMRQTPSLFKFLKSACLETDPEIAREIKLISDDNKNSVMPSFFKNIDFSKLKTGIDPEKVFKVISWCSEGFLRALEEKETYEIEQTFFEFDAYLDLFRDNFYKEGEQ